MDKKNIASGLPGFGTKGKKGSTGVDGLSVYFTNLDGEINRQTISQLIKENKSLVNNEDGDSIPMLRDYMSGDLFVDVSSNLYEIQLHSSNIYKSLGYKYIPNNIFESTNHTNIFGYEKKTNIYLGDNKFLVDDIQSDLFSSNIYDYTTYGDNRLGDFTKVNYTDKKAKNNLYLHEAYISETNQDRIFGIVSRTVNDGTREYNEFRIGNANISILPNGVEVFTPTTMEMTIDAKRLEIPQDSYIISNNTSYKILSTKDYDMGVFKFLKSSDIQLGSIGIIDAILEDTSSEDFYNLIISRCNFGDLFNDFNTHKDNMRVNIIASRVLDDNSTVDINTKNEYTIYNISDGAQDIKLEKIPKGNWMIVLEIIDNSTGWSRISRPYNLLKGTESLSLYTRFINSYTSDLTFNLTVSTDGNVECFNKNYNIKSLSALSLEDEEGENSHLRIPIPLPSTPLSRITTKVYVKCTVKNGDKTFVMQILNDEGNAPSFDEFVNNEYIMFHLGYEADTDVEYDKENIKFLTTLTPKGYVDVLYLNIPRNISYNPNLDGDYVNYFYDEVLASKYGNPQDFIHEQDLTLKIFNTSPLSLIAPKKVYFYSSDSYFENILSESFINKLRVCEVTTDEVIDIFGVSKTSYKVKVGSKAKYLYVFVDNLISNIVNGISFSYDKSQVMNICNSIGRSACIINNPYISTLNRELLNDAIYLTISNREFSSTSIGGQPLLNGEKNNFGRGNNIVVDLSLSDKIKLNPMFIGFNVDKLFYKKVGNDVVINNSANDANIFNSIGLYAGGYNILDTTKGTNQNEFTAPYALDGLTKEIRFTLSPNISSYSSFFNTCNAEAIYDRFFEVIKDQNFRDLVDFGQYILKPETEYVSISETYTPSTSNYSIFDQTSSELSDFVNSSLASVSYINKNTTYKPFGDSDIDLDYIDVELDVPLYVREDSGLKFETPYANTIADNPTTVRWSHIHIEPIMVCSYVLEGERLPHLEYISLVSGKTINDIGFDNNITEDNRKMIYVDNLFGLRADGVNSFNPLYQSVGPNNKTHIKYNGRVNIGNKGVIKKEFKYSLRFKITNLSTYAISYNDYQGDGGTDAPIILTSNTYTRQTYNNINIILDDAVIKVGYLGANTLDPSQAISNRFIDKGTTSIEINKYSL